MKRNGLILLIGCAVFFSACSQDTNRTREKSADATAQLEPARQDVPWAHPSRVRPRVRLWKGRLGFSFRAS